MKTRRQLWGRAKDGKAIYRYTITNESGASVTLTNIGAGIVAVNVPDRNGKLGDVALGYGKAEQYFYDDACMGKCPGPFANRIDNASFTIDGKTFNLPKNNIKNCLHSGPEGFQNKVWESRKKNGGVEFKYLSPDEENGFPGNKTVVVRYEWSEQNELRITFSAKTDAKTVINLTNHAYFNLDGSKTIFRHSLKLNSSEYLLADKTLCPTGLFEPVQGTPMDFRKEKTLGKDIKKDYPALIDAGGYDSCWVIDGYIPGQLQEAAQLYSKKSGRVLTVFTTQPGIHVYTGNYLGKSCTGKRGRKYGDYSGVALECQHYPDSPNKPQFPSTVLKPGKIFHEAIIFAFGMK